MNHYTAIQNLKAPEEFAGKIDWRIVFEIDGCGDETSFDIDCSAPDWREELKILWEDFCEDNGFPVDSIYDIYYVLPRTLTAKCSCCGYVEKFTLTPEESEMLEYYELRSRGIWKLQDMFPRIPAWIRSGAIDKSSGGFCICPRCCP